MHLKTILRPFAISVVLLSVSPAFAARVIHPHVQDICRDQQVGCYRWIPFKAENPNAIDDGQAKANAASKTWPGYMMLD
jgi:hypothetical protein